MNKTCERDAKWKKIDPQTTYYMIPFIWNIQNRQTHGDRSSFVIARLWERELEDASFLWRKMKIS